MIPASNSMPMDDNLAKEKEAWGARGLAQLSRGLLQGTTRGAAMQWSLFFCCRERSPRKRVQTDQLEKWIKDDKRQVHTDYHRCPSSLLVNWTCGIGFSLLFGWSFDWFTHWNTNSRLRWYEKQFLKLIILEYEFSCFVYSPLLFFHPFGSLLLSLSCFRRGK